MIKTDKLTKEMEAFLAKEPLINQNMMGIIKTYPGASLICDDPKAPKGLALHTPGYMRYIVSRDQDFLEKYYQTYGRNDSFGIAGSNDFVRSFFGERAVITWESPCTQLHYDGELPDYPDDEHLRPLVEADAELVTAYYEYRGDHTLQEVKEAIKHRPTMGYELAGKLVSWVLLHEDYSMGYMYTLEEMRKHGIAHIVTRAMIHNCMKEGILPYVQIVKGNTKSEGLAKKSGFVAHGEVYWHGVLGEDYHWETGGVIQEGTYVAGSLYELSKTPAPDKGEIHPDFFKVGEKIYPYVIHEEVLVFLTPFTSNEEGLKVIHTAAHEFPHEEVYLIVYPPFDHSSIKEVRVQVS